MYQPEIVDAPCSLHGWVPKLVSRNNGRRDAICPSETNALIIAIAIRLAMLETNNLTKRFGGHVAVNAVSCSFAPGTLTAIVGPNGAGKTTYFNLISGQILGRLPETSGWTGGPYPVFVRRPGRHRPASVVRSN